MSWEGTSDHQGADGRPPGDVEMPTCIGHRGGLPCGRAAAREFLCEMCRIAIRRQLRRFPSALLLVRATGTADRIVVHTSSEPRLPGQGWLEIAGPTMGDAHLQLDLDDLAAIGDAANLPVPASAVLASWARIVCEERPAEPPRLRTDAVARLTDLTHWWDRHADWAASQAWADDWQAEMNEAYRLLWSVAGLHYDISKVPVPCPECGHQTVRRYGPRRPPEPQANGALVADPVIYVCDRDGGCGSARPASGPLDSDGQAVDVPGTWDRYVAHISEGFATKSPRGTEAPGDWIAA